tara:strand:- start:167 stop:559 length:393 start_codon:yes stop_codon:yes gene_type:complete
MKTTSTKLNKAIDNYVRSVRILLATVIGVPIFLLLLFYTPFILYLIIFVPLSFTIFFLIVSENEKIKDVIEWGNWIDHKISSQEYLDGLLYIHHRQLAHALDPTEPHYFFCTSDLDYETFLKQKYQYKHF